ncbi:MAG: MMPL family transporter [Spirochaetales bacterium]|nr:MMPL family transporter [Spirochaetales bacterium]
MKKNSIDRIIVFSIIVVSVLLIIFSALNLQLDSQITNMLPRDENLIRSIALTADSSVSDKLLLYIHNDDAEKIDQMIDKADSVIQNAAFLIPNIPTAQQINEIKLYLQKNAFVLYPYEAFDAPFSADEMEVRLKNKFAYLQSNPFEDLGELFFADPLNQISDLMKLQFSSSNPLSVYRDGILSEDKTSFLRVFSTGSSSSDTRKSTHLLDLDKKIVSIGEECDGNSFLYGAHFYFMESSSTIRQEVSVICIFSIILTIFVFFFFFRNIELIFYAFMPVIAGMAFTFLSILIFCGKFGAIALGFGATAAGICIDYSVHYLFKADFYPTLKDLRRGIGKPLFMGYVTTVLSFLLLLLSRIDSLGEIALFGCLVITFSFIFCWFVLQTILPPEKIFYHVTYISFGEKLFAHWRIPFLCLFACLAVASIFTHLETDSSKLDIAHKKLNARAEKIITEFGESTNNVFIGFPGKTKDEAIDSAMNATLAIYKEKPQLLFLNPAIFLPTEHVVRSRIDYIANNFNKQRFLEAAAQSDFTEEAFASFFAALESMENGTFRLGEFPDYLKMQSDASIAEYNGMYYFMVHIGDRTRAEETYACLESLNREYVPVDIMRDSVKGLQLFEMKSMILIGIAVILIFFVIFIAFGNIRIALTSILPIIAGLVGIVGINALIQKPINIMHITSAILVVGIGVDYGILSSSTWNMRFKKELSDEEWIEKRNSTVQSILTAAATTLASFGLLTFSSSGALFSLGISMIFGIIFAFCTAVLIIPLAYGDK